MPTNRTHTPFASRPAWLLIGASAITALLFGSSLWWAPGTPWATDPNYVSIQLPLRHALVAGPEISPGGDRIASVATSGADRPQFYTIRFSEPELQRLEGTEEAREFFFAPDGLWIAFYARNALYKVSVSGGAPVRLTDAPSSAGGAWLEDGTIVFTPGWNSGLYSIAENGGVPEPLLKPDGQDSYAWT